MKKLYIHAGNHKTGTSSVQKYLFENRDLFLDKGYACFLEDHKQEEVRGNHSWWFDHSRLKNGSAYFRPGFVESLSRHSERADNVVISSECFSWVFDSEALKKFAGQLRSIYDDVQVIFYIRRQDRHAVSHYQQAAKSFAEREFFSGKNGALPDLTDNVINYLDYYKKLGLWENAFGRGSVCFRVFDDHLAKFGVVPDFLDIIGVEPAGFPCEGARANESWGWEQTKVFRILNNLGIRHQSELGKSIKKYLDGNGKLLPTRSEAQDFLSFFDGSNSMLAEKLGFEAHQPLFEDDFSFYPDSSQDFFDEESANKAIENLSKGFLDYINGHKK